MKLLLDDAGHAVLEDGKPVYEAGDGKRIAFDAPQTVATITRLNAEAKAHREGKEAAEARLKAFGGIEDADAARKALETIRNIDAKKLIDAGDVERVRADMAKTYEQQVKAAKDEAESFFRHAGFPLREKQ